MRKIRRLVFPSIFFIFLSILCLYREWFLPRRKKILMMISLVFFMYLCIGTTNAFITHREIKEYKSFKNYYSWLSLEVYSEISKVSKEENFPDRNLICAVIQAESGDYCRNNLNRMFKVVSYAGAIGIMQVMPYHADNKRDLYSYSFNIKKGVWYLKKCLVKSKGNIKEACRLYNAGLHNPENKYKNWKYVANMLNYYLEYIRKSGTSSKISGDINVKITSL